LAVRVCYTATAHVQSYFIRTGCEALKMILSSKSWVILTERSCAGNQRFCNLISKVKDVINMDVSFSNTKNLMNMKPSRWLSSFVSI